MFGKGTLLRCHIQACPRVRLRMSGAGDNRFHLAGSGSRSLLKSDGPSIARALDGQP